MRGIDPDQFRPWISDSFPDIGCKLFLLGAANQLAASRMDPKTPQTNSEAPPLRIGSGQ